MDVIFFVYAALNLSFDTCYTDVIVCECSTDTRYFFNVQMYDDTDATPLTMLPPRHCMYGLTPGSEPIRVATGSSVAKGDEDDEAGV